MIFGNKSDLKKHLSVKRPTWAHKVVAHSPLEHNLEHNLERNLERNQEMERREESPANRDAPPHTDRPESMQSRY